MKVWDLIVALQKMPMDAEVRVGRHADVPDYIYFDGPTVLTPEFAREFEDGIAIIATHAI